MTKNKKSSDSEIVAMRRLLHAAYPKAFANFGEGKTPLAIGIDKQIYEALKPSVPGISRRTLHSALANYTGGLKYLDTMIAGAARINIEGEPAGVVTEHEAKVAAAHAARIRARIAKAQERRAAMAAKEKEAPIKERDPC